MSNAAQVLIRRSTNVVELKKLRDKISGAYYTDLTVVLTLFDEDGNQVTGAVNLSMPYVSGTTGASTTYRTAIAHTVDLSGESYTAVITITRAGIVREINVTCTAVDG